MVYRLMITTLAVGAAFAALGMAESTFKHYYKKYADFEDMKHTGVQEVTFVGDAEVME